MKKNYKLENLDCAVCAQKIENKVKKLDGIEDVNVSFMLSKMTVDYKDNVDVEEKYAQILKVCKKVEPDCVVKG